MFQAERTKALGRNELGVFKKEKGNQFFWNTGRSILGEDRAHIRLKKNRSALLRHIRFILIS